MISRYKNYFFVNFFLAKQRLQNEKANHIFSVHGIFAGLRDSHGRRPGPSKALRLVGTGYL
jgi:hypothetical protein